MNQIQITSNDSFVYAYLVVDSNFYELERLAKTSDKKQHDYLRFTQIFQTHARSLNMVFAMSEQVKKLCGIEPKKTVVIDAEALQKLINFKLEIEGCYESKSYGYFPKLSKLIDDLKKT